MSVDLIVGLQYGSEGKGKVAAMLAPLYKGAVRVGAPNAGHTIIHNGATYKMRQIPCAWVNPQCALFIGAGGLVSEEVFADEIAMISDYVGSRIVIDANAGVVLPSDRDQEIHGGMNAFNGSTAEGIGPALARKLMRKHGTIVRGHPYFSTYAGDTKRMINALLDDHHRVMIEGTQGYGLSLNHGPYPFCTSRDVLAASLLSDVGLAPLDCGAVYGVLRTYPIRVAGNSGPMGAEELTWADVARESGYPALEERTTVTRRIRRVSRIDWDLLQEAVRANGCTGLFIMFADYLDSGVQRMDTEAGQMYFREHQGGKITEFVAEVIRRLGVPVIALSTGPNPEHTIWLDRFIERQLKEAVHVG